MNDKPDKARLVEQVTNAAGKLWDSLPGGGGEAAQEESANYCAARFALPPERDDNGLVSAVQAWLDDFNTQNEDDAGMSFFDAQDKAEELQKILAAAQAKARA